MQLDQECVDIIEEWISLPEDYVTHTGDCLSRLNDRMASLDPWQSDALSHYFVCREMGTSKSLAEMFALAKPPKSQSDVEFLRGHCNGNQFEGGPIANRMGDYYRRVAESKGQTTKGKVYLSSLAAYPGDPEAFVSGKSDVRRVAESRGWKVTGAVNVKGRE